MYIEHFGLAQYPFSLTPNTRYFLKLPSHQRAFDFIIESLQDGCSFTKITAEIGTGKTMLCRKVLNALEAHTGRYTTAFIPNPVLDEEGMMHAVAEELRLSYDPDISYYDALKIVSEGLLHYSAEGKTAVLLIDEAQALAEESLEAIRLLTIIEKAPDGALPLQIILFGQPELDELLERPSMRELSREINASYQLDTLDRDDVQSYLNHRLLKAGFSGSNLFDEKAVDLIYQGSKGVPRLVNILAHKSLLVAFGKGDQAVTDKHIELAIEDTEAAHQNKPGANRFF